VSLNSSFVEKEALHIKNRLALNEVQIEEDLLQLFSSKFRGISRNAQHFLQKRKRHRCQEMTWSVLEGAAIGSDSLISSSATCFSDSGSTSLIFRSLPPVKPKM